MRKGRLAEKIVSYMVIVALGGVPMSVLCLSLFYSLFLNERWELKGMDYFALAVLCSCGLALALGAARSLSRRIIAPITAVAEAARRIADGDLSARVPIDGSNMGEVAELSHDFNQMAERLEQLASEVRLTNAAIAHELRTPLTILRGRLQGVSDGVYPLDAGLIASALGQVDALTRLVEYLRFFTLSDRDYASNFAPVSLEQVICDLRDLMNNPLHMDGFDVVWRTEPAMVIGDGIWLHQSILAILENARRHANRGPLSVELSCGGDVAIIRIADSGPGIPEDILETVFEPFQRGPTLAKGSGLGLAIVRATAEAHGGSARCFLSPQTGGAVFEITIPLMKDEPFQP